MANIYNLRPRRHTPNFYLSVLVILSFVFISTKVLADLPDDVTLQYDDQAKITIVFSHEKLISGDTSVEAAYSFNGHDLAAPPQQANITFFGHHDVAAWQAIDSVSITYDGKTVSCKVLHSIHGEDRDKTIDLVPSKYLETIVLILPLDTVVDILKSQHVTVDSFDGSVHLRLSQEQTDRCRDTLATIPTVVATRAKQAYQSSADGLPLASEINSGEGYVALKTTTVDINSQFGFSVFTYVTVNGGPYIINVHALSSKKQMIIP